MGRLKEIKERYKGPMMNEDIRWCTDEIERLRKDYGEMCFWLIEASEGNGVPMVMTNIAKKYLQALKEEPVKEYDNKGNPREG